MPADNPLLPYGRALADYAAGKTGGSIVIHEDPSEADDMPVAVFFRQPVDFFSFENAAIEICKGRVLDAGAGTGLHSLVLQERGLDVTAIDILPEAIAIMRGRGVVDVREEDLFQMEGESYDTILMMMNGIGIVGTVERLDNFFEAAAQLLRPGGQVLVDSAAPDERAARAGLPPGIYWKSDRYAGEAKIRIEYAGEIGGEFDELYVDSRTLGERAARNGFRCELAFVSEDGYTARLTRSASVST